MLLYITRYYYLLLNSVTVTQPDFTLPAGVDGEIEQLTFSEYAADQLTVLAFYPADFSPTCTDELCSLRDIDLFNLQDEISILGISTDSAFSHLEFARQNGLEFPLLSDNDGRIAELFGVLHGEYDGHNRLAKRAVFVVDDRQEIRYAWSTDDPSQLPDIDAIRGAVGSVQDDRGAIDRYRSAHDHYRYGRSELENARAAYAGENWGVAAEAFAEAEYYFEEAESGFDTARRFAESTNVVRTAESAKTKTNQYRQCARWYGKAARRRTDGDTPLATGTEADAEAALDAAREMEPVQDLYTL